MNVVNQLYQRHNIFGNKKQAPVFEERQRQTKIFWIDNNIFQIDRIIEKRLFNTGWKL